MFAIGFRAAGQMWPVAQDSYNGASSRQVITYRITTVRVNDEPPRDAGVEGQPTSKDSASGNGGVRPDVPHPSAPAAAAQSAAAASPATGEAAVSHGLIDRPTAWSAGRQNGYMRADLLRSLLRL